MTENGERKYTRITLENENGTFSVRVEKTNMNIDDIKDDLIFPLLLAAKYNFETIDAALQGREKL